MNELTELNQVPSQLQAEDRLREMEAEEGVKQDIKIAEAGYTDDVKSDIKRGKGTRTIAKKYAVAEAFVWKCRAEMRAEGEL